MQTKLVFFCKFCPFCNILIAEIVKILVDYVILMKNAKLCDICKSIQK